MTSLIVAWILFLQGVVSPSWNETQEAYIQRVTMTGEEIESVTKHDSRLARAIVVTFWGESRFSPRVQSGEHRGDNGLALCMGGNHRGDLTEEEWLSMIGLDRAAIHKCVEVTARRLRMARTYCHDLDPKFDYPEAMVLYGTGQTCRANESKWKNIFLDRGAKWNQLKGLVAR